VRPIDEDTVARGTDIYRRFLFACAEEGLTLVAAGRFVKPGREVSENAPLMAFFPLRARPDDDPRALRELLERRYDAYRDHVVHPLFRDHFARSDRQIVLVDVLKALAGGPHALADMRDALTVILRSFDHGSAAGSAHLRAAHRPRAVRRHQVRPRAARAVPESPATPGGDDHFTRPRDPLRRRPNTDGGHRRRAMHRECRGRA
jgi:predicted YcjX-like family ATPase